MAEVTATNTVERHLRRLLREPARITTPRDAEGPAPFRIATYRDLPAEGASTLITIGISECPLAAPDGQQVRQELLLCAWDRFVNDRLYAVTATIAAHVLDAGETVNPGAVLVLPEPILPGGALRQLFVYEPTYHDDSLQPVAFGHEEIEIVWLVPITDAEADFIEARGPQAFTEELTEKDPDLMDLERESAV